MKKQNCVIWIQIVSLYTEKHDIYKDVAEEVKLDLVLQIMN